MTKNCIYNRILKKVRRNDEIRKVSNSKEIRSKNIQYKIYKVIFIL